MRVASVAERVLSFITAPILSAIWNVRALPEVAAIGTCVFDMAAETISRAIADLLAAEVAPR